MMWMVGGVLVLLVARFLWLAFFHRVNAMSRQAELMNWLDIGRVSNADGGRIFCWREMSAVPGSTGARARSG